MVDIIPLKKWPGGIGEAEPGDKISAEFLPLSDFPSAYRNKIINGKMEISQRGSSFPAAAFGAYTLDRWAYACAASAVATVSQQPDAPASNEFRVSLRAAITTADTSIASDEYSILTQRLEGYNVRDLIGRTFTLSFWVRSSKTGTHCVSFANSGGDRSYVVEYTILAADTWEHKTITVPGGLITAGTWNWLDGIGLNLRFALAAGSNYITAADAWQSGNFLTTANQVNVLDAVGNIFAITGVQLEVGPVSTPFEHRPHGAELQLCQRYYQAYGRFRASQYSAGASAISMQSPFPIVPTMRATPTVVLGSASVLANTSALALLIESASSASWSWNSVDAGQSFWVVDSTTLSAEL